MQQSHFLVTGLHCRQPIFHATLFSTRLCSCHSRAWLFCYVVSFVLMWFSSVHVLHSAGGLTASWFLCCFVCYNFESALPCLRRQHFFGIPLCDAGSSRSIRRRR
jgi:hypothetical protein